MMLTQCIEAGDEARRPGYLLRFDYKSELVAALTSAIPHTEREWRPDSKEWWVSKRYAHVLTRLFPNFEALTKLQARMF